VDALVGVTAGKLGLMRWYFGSASENSSIPSDDLRASGFSPVPGPWIAAAKNLLTVYAPTKIAIPGKANTACASVTKGA
jgi:hypothetical protein